MQRSMPYMFKTQSQNLEKNGPFYGGMPKDYTPMQDLSIDIKHMPTTFGGYQYLLVVTCDQTNFMIALLGIEMLK